MAYQNDTRMAQNAQHSRTPHDYDRGYSGRPAPRSGYAQDNYAGRYENEHEQYQQDAYSHNGQYAQQYDTRYNQQFDRQYEQSWNDRECQTHYREREPQEYHDYQQQAREYRYDERYRTSGNAQFPNDSSGPNQQSSRSPQNSRPGTSASNRRNKKERILDNSADQLSPKATAWDNPFGVFPGSKKDIEEKKKESDDLRSRSRTDNPPDRRPIAVSSRPGAVNHNHQLSGASRPSLEDPPRPHTSHGTVPRRKPVEQAQPSFNQPLGPLDDMPLRKKPPPLNHELHSRGQYGQEEPPRSATVGAFDLPVRPAVQRSASGPDPQQQRPNQSSAYGGGVYQPNAIPQQRDFSSERHSQTETLYPNQDRSSNDIHSQTHRARNGSDRRPSHSDRSRGETTYRGVEHNTPATLPDSMTPNFGAMPPHATENVESAITLQQRPVGDVSNMPAVYRKPTYGDMSTKPPPVRPGLVDSAQQSQPQQFSSPIENFEFNLNQHDQSPHVRMSSDEHRQQGYYQDGPSQQSTQRSQYPPRSGSRPDMRQHTSGFTHPYNQPPMPRQEPYAQQPAAQQYDEYWTTHNTARPAHQEYPEDVYDQYAEEPYRQPLNRTYTEPINTQPGAPPDHYNHGYGQRSRDQRPPPPTSQSSYAREPSMRRQQYQDPSYEQYPAQAPPRPRTANSSRPPQQQYPSQPLPMPQTSSHQQGLPTADRNHPVPVRPGLMAPPSAPGHISSPPPMQMNRGSPPQNRPPPQQGMPAQPRQDVSPSPAKQPVTVNELNELRHSFKDRPNDDKLGLMFAKRLVEASVVLANDGGRADAKRTAENRERYVNDAYRIVKRLVANGSPDAMFYLADCYGQGSLGLETNAKEAFQLYTSAAKMGHPQSAYRVAVCCELGQEEGGGTRRDHAKAVQFYKRAATLGDGPAMFKMGMILLKGLLGQQPNRREGISWLKRAAERADEETPHAVHELAMLYETAQSTDVIIRDEGYAFSLFTQAANLGYKYSQHRLGSAYEYGTLGCQIDPRQSISWYSRAAQQGEHQSEFALSGWYLTGSEPLLAQSDNEAYLWARKAAQSGLAKAEYAMGYYTEVGIGCPSNLDEARKWYFRAAAQSDARAKERLEEIKRGGKRKEKTRISRSQVGRHNEGECVVM